MEKGEELDKHLEKLHKEIKDKLNDYKAGIPVSISRRVKLTKLSDDVFNGMHPNGINQGYVKEGYEIDPPKVGQGYMVGWSWSTSIVTEIIDNNTFKTLNSTYKIEYLDENMAF